MAEKNVDNIIKNLREGSYYPVDYDDYLSQFTWGDKDYNSQRQKAYNYLISNGFDVNQANKLLDAHITKRTYENNKKNVPLLSKKYGILATGSNWDDSQKRAIEIFKNSKNAPFGVVYGLRNAKDPKENTHKTDGLNTPFAVTEEELKDLIRYMKMPTVDDDFQFDVYFGNNIDK